jgi:hypothetical protein
MSAGVKIDHARLPHPSLGPESTASYLVEIDGAVKFGVCLIRLATIRRVSAQSELFFSQLQSFSYAKDSGVHICTNDGLRS